MISKGLVNHRLLERIKAASEVWLTDTLEGRHLKEAPPTALIIVGGDVQEHQDNTTDFAWTHWPLRKRLRSHEQAFQIEPEMTRRLKERKKFPSGGLCRLYNTQEVDRAFRKFLLESLQSYYELEDMLHLLQFHSEKTKLFVAASWQWWQMHELLGDCGLLRECDHACATNGLEMKTRVPFRRRLALITGILAAPFWILTQVRRIRFSQRTNPVTLGIRLYGNSFRVGEEYSPRADWMVDGKNFDTGNTVIFGETKLPSYHLEDIQKCGYKYVDATRRGAVTDVTLKFLIYDLALRVILLTLPGCFFLFRSPTFLVYAIREGVLDWLRWRALTAYWRPLAYVAYNHMAPQHVFRNIVLEKAQCRTVFYQHTNSNYSLYVQDSDIRGLHVNWGLMYHFLEAHWGQQQVMTWMNSGTHAVVRKKFGSFWSLNVRQDKGFSDWLEEKDVRSGNSKGPLIAAFNTSFDTLNGLNGPDLHREFLEGLMGLVNSPASNQARLVFKPKKPFERFFEIGDADLIRVARAFAEHPRIYITNRVGIVGAVIGRADLTITMGFASPSIEGLMAGRKAMYFDAMDAYPTAHFREIPGLVAVGLEDLINKAKEWLDMSETDFANFRQEWLVKEYGNTTENPRQLFVNELLRITRSDFQPQTLKPSFKNARNIP